MAKKIYAKPEINKVRLLPKEAVLTNCKRSDGPVSTSEPCNTSGHRCASSEQGT
jgi:hypothetical protein